MALWYRDKGTSGTQFAVMSGDGCIGSISKDVFAGSKDVHWDWTVHIDCGPPGFKRFGRGDTGEEAKASFERNWQLWIDAARLRERQ